MRNGVFALIGVLTITAGPSAQAPASAPSGYLTPPKAIADIMDAAPNPTVVVAPTHDVMAVISRRSMPSIAEISRPMLRIAGERIDPQNNGPHLHASRHRHHAACGVRVGAAADGRGAGERAHRHRRSSHRTASGSPSPTRATRASISTSPMSRPGRAGWWTPPSTVSRATATGSTTAPVSSADSCRHHAPPRRPSRRCPPARTSRRTTASRDRFRPSRTCSKARTTRTCSSTTSPHSWAIVDAATGRRTPIGKPALIGGFSVSPDGQFVLVEKIKRPFSHLLPWDGFPKDVEVWTRRGDKARTIADVPMSDTVPINGVITGPRAYRWNPTEPATLVWVEALDKGDIRNTVPNRDRVVTLKAPFTGGSDRGRKNGVPLRRHQLDRQRHDPADRKRSRDADHAHVATDLQLERTAQALGSQAAGLVLESRHADGAAGQRHRAAGRRRDLF